MINFRSMKSKVSKYKSVRTEVDGERFDSKREARRYAQLALMERAGEITELRRQVPYVLAPQARFTHARTSPELRYFADFVYRNKAGTIIVEDVKSAISRKLAAYRIKRHLMRTVHGIEITEVM